MHDVAEDLLVLGWESQHRGDDARRDELREVRSPIDELASLHLVEVLVAERANLRLQRVDRSRREGRQDDTTRDRVKGRVRRDRWRASDGRRDEVRRVLVVHDDDHAAREVLSVVRDRRDHLVRRGEPAAAVSIGVGDRTTLAQVLPDRVGIVHPARIGVVPVRCKVFDRQLVRHRFVDDVGHSRLPRTGLESAGSVVRESDPAPRSPPLRRPVRTSGIAL